MGMELDSSHLLVSESPQTATKKSKKKRKREKERRENQVRTLEPIETGLIVLGAAYLYSRRAYHCHSWILALRCGRDKEALQLTWVCMGVSAT